MKFSEAWLRTWVDPPISREALFEQLTMAGLEVEASEAVAEAFTGVVVGKVVSVYKTPRCRQAVCLPGGRWHDNTTRWFAVRQTFAMVWYRPSPVSVLFYRETSRSRKRSLRDVESHGMLCSPAELGLGDDADGIIELAADSEIGVDLRTALALDDVTIDLDLTPNRG